MNTNVLRAVFTRNFVAYFASPTGYVFICVFVLLSSIAAFWPHEFFASNLANLEQLNRFFPLIMLIFIPAITMSVWAEERRQGTDELLLTVPAGDLDIVLGKYLAAVAIFTVSLLFSLVCNFCVLAYLGNPDAGLFVATYLGYWLVGLAMLAVGMVASFLTANLTVAFVLGALFNVPLVALMWSDVIVDDRAARVLKQWSISAHFNDFGRGIISLSGLVYFGTILVVMLYLCMVLIGRRHWARGRDWPVMAGHFLVRTLALAVLAVTATIFFHQYDVRLDVTAERLSSLSPKTVDLLGNLDLKRPVRVEAFISPEVPESYVQTRLDVLNMLQELQAYGGSEVIVRIHNTELFSEDAARAEERYGITPRRVVSMDRGTLNEDQIFLGVAFTCGLDKVVLPFVNRGIPVEYELVRSICTVIQQERKKIGILKTDAQLYGSFNFQTMSSSPNWPIVDELEKMYEVVEVDPAQPITERYDALLAVQPSSLGPDEMKNFIAAVKAGQPTAVFEDPFPGFAGNVPATSAPRRPPGGMNPMMMQRQQAPPKGNLAELWNLLGVDFSGDQIVWQDHNPYPKLGHLPSELVFVDDEAAAPKAFNQDSPISSKLELLLFPFPGSISKLPGSKLEFEELARTGESTGTVAFRDMISMGPFGPSGGLNPNRRHDTTGLPYILAVHIKGKLPAEKPMADDEAEHAHEHADHDHADHDHADHDHADHSQDATDGGAKPDESKPQDVDIDVVVVADIDMLHREFFNLREQGDNPEVGIDFNFDNVTFVLNLLDVLAGDDRFVEIRKRRPKHRTLTRIDERVEDARHETTKAVDRLQLQFQEEQEKEQEALNKKMDKLRENLREEKLDDQEILRRVALALKVAQDRQQATAERLQQELEHKVKQIETKQALEIRQVQDGYKFWAVVLPPILPLILAIIVFFARRAAEREGVSRNRLR